MEKGLGGTVNELCKDFLEGTLEHSMFPYVLKTSEVKTLLNRIAHVLEGIVDSENYPKDTGGYSEDSCYFSILNGFPKYVCIGSRIGLALIFNVFPQFPNLKRLDISPHSGPEIEWLLMFLSKHETSLFYLTIRTHWRLNLILQDWTDGFLLFFLANPYIQSIRFIDAKHFERPPFAQTLEKHCLRNKERYNCFQAAVLCMLGIWKFKRNESPLLQSLPRDVFYLIVQRVWEMRWGDTSI